MSPKTPPNSVFEIADWFLLRAKSEDKPLKHMKLQKLVYFAYGWYCAYFDKPLFGETIWAWQHGPVVEELYHKYKQFKKYPIEMDGIADPQIGEDVLSILVEVWESYSHCTDSHLQNITHRPDSPWSKVYNRRDRNIEIPTPDIQEYFKRIR